MAAGPAWIPLVPQPLDDGDAHPVPIIKDLGTVTIAGHAYADTNDQIGDGRLIVPAIDTGGTVRIYAALLADTPASGRNVELRFSERQPADDEDVDGAYANHDFGDIALNYSAGEDRVTVATLDITVATLGWAAEDLVPWQLARIAPSANDLSGHLILWGAWARVPLAA